MRITLPFKDDPVLKGIQWEETETEKGPEVREKSVNRMEGWRYLQGFDITQKGHKLWYFTAWLIGRMIKDGPHAGTKIKGRGWALITALVFIGGVIFTLYTRTGVWWANLGLGAVESTVLLTVMALSWPSMHVRVVIEQRAGMMVPVYWVREEGTIKYEYRRLTEDRITHYRFPIEMLDNIVRIDTIEHKSRLGVLTIKGVLVIGNIIWGERRYSELGIAAVDELYPTTTVFPPDADDVRSAFAKTAEKQDLTDAEVKEAHSLIDDIYALEIRKDAKVKRLNELAGSQIVEIDRASRTAKFFVTTIDTQHKAFLDKVKQSHLKVEKNIDEPLTKLNKAIKILTEEYNINLRIQTAEESGRQEQKAIDLELLTGKGEMARKAKEKEDLPLDEASSRSKDIKSRNDAQDELDKYLGGDHLNV